MHLIELMIVLGLTTVKFIIWIKLIITNDFCFDNWFNISFKEIVIVFTKAF